MSTRPSFAKAPELEAESLTPKAQNPELAETPKPYNPQVPEPVKMADPTANNYLKVHGT